MCPDRETHLWVVGANPDDNVSPEPIGSAHRADEDFLVIHASPVRARTSPACNPCGRTQSNDRGPLGTTVTSMLLLSAATCAAPVDVDEIDADLLTAGQRRDHRAQCRCGTALTTDDLADVGGVPVSYTHLTLPTIYSV